MTAASPMTQSSCLLRTTATCSVRAGETHKQRPWDESIRVPFLLRYPKKFGRCAHTSEMMLTSVDLMPTMLGLCGVDIPSTVQGRDRSHEFERGGVDEKDAALLTCYVPFGQWVRSKGGREYRGVRTPRYTYVRSLDGPWLLYDNDTDPYQSPNLCNVPGHEKLQGHLQTLLASKLEEAEDSFLPARHYIEKWELHGRCERDGTLRALEKALPSLAHIIALIFLLRARPNVA